MPSGERLNELAARLLARARPPLPGDLVTLRVAGYPIGFVRPDVARFLRHTDDYAWRDGELVLMDRGMDEARRSACLERTAVALRDASMLTGWRDELLSVRQGEHPRWDQHEWRAMNEWLTECDRDAEPLSRSNSERAAIRVTR